MKITTYAEANIEFDYFYSDCHTIAENVIPRHHEQTTPAAIHASAVADLGTVEDACEDFLRFVLKMEWLTESRAAAAAAID